MNISEIKLKLDQLIGQQVTIVNKVKNSAGHLDAYAGKIGKLNEYSAGSSQKEILVNVIFEVTVGKKNPRIEEVSLWIDSRDIVGFEK